MKNIAITIFTIIIVAALGLYLVSFQVRETESCLMMTFGKPSQPITEPGWYFKWPYPIQKPEKYDSRMKVYAPEAEETTTAGGEPIIVNTYVVWRISDPLLHYKATNDVSDFERELLRSQIRNVQNSIIGRHDFSEFVNSDEDKIAFKDIEDEMLTELRTSVAEAQFGIEIKTLGIKQLKISEDVSKKVFDRMRAERIRKADDTRSEGDARASQITEEAKQIRQQILAAVEALAIKIEGEGEAEAANYYSVMQEYPEFAEFLIAIERIPKAIEGNATFVIDTSKPPFDILMKKPVLESLDTNEPADVNAIEAFEE